MEDLRFQDAMLAKYGCGTVEAVAGRCQPADVLAAVLNDDVFFSPEFFASLLVIWFGGFANGYAVRAQQSSKVVSFFGSRMRVSPKISCSAILGGPVCSASRCHFLPCTLVASL